MKPRIWDSFPLAGTDDELLLLECRLTELYGTVDGFIIVEADVDHQDHPKPYNFEANQERFRQWSDKITYIKATDLPHIEPGHTHDEDPWAREHAQREFILDGLNAVSADENDIILQSDADEIPRPLHVRNCRPQGSHLISFEQRGHFWAIDWQYPHPWCGTVAMRVGNLDFLAKSHGTHGPFTAMRNTRNINQTKLPDAGWHFSWLGDHAAWMAKVNRFCHPEVKDRIENLADNYFNSGIHVDGVVMRPVDVDSSWPKWMQNPDNIPTSWLRPR